MLRLAEEVEGMVLGLLGLTEDLYQDQPRTVVNRN